MNSEKVQTGVIHFRGKDARGGVTIQYEFEKFKSLAIHYAICSPDDNYCRKTGLSVINESSHERLILITPDGQESTDFFDELPSRTMIISELMEALSTAFEYELDKSGRVNHRTQTFDYVRVVRSVLESINSSPLPEETLVNSMISDDIENLYELGYMTSNRPPKVVKEIGISSLANIIDYTIPGN